MLCLARSGRDKVAAAQMSGDIRLGSGDVYSWAAFQLTHGCSLMVVSMFAQGESSGHNDQRFLVFDGGQNCPDPGMGDYDTRSRKERFEICRVHEIETLDAISVQSIRTHLRDYAFTLVFSELCDSIDQCRKCQLGSYGYEDQRIDPM